MLAMRIQGRRSKNERAHTEGVFTLSDAPPFSGLTSKIPLLGSMLNFDADVKNMTARHQYENRLRLRVQGRDTRTSPH